MNAPTIIVLAIVVVIVVAVVLKMTLFKGPKWKRDMDKANRAAREGKR